MHCGILPMVEEIKLTIPESVRRLREQREQDERDGVQEIKIKSKQGQGIYINRKATEPRPRRPLVRGH